MTLKAYRYRFYPDKEQESYLNKSFGSTRFVYNWSLGEIKKALDERKINPEHKIKSWIDLSRELTQIKKTYEFKWLSECPRVPMGQSLRHLDKSFRNFFRNRKKFRFPTFKNRYSAQSITFSGAKTFRFKDGEIYLPKLKKPLKIKWSREFPGTPTSLTISKDKAECYHISILVNEEIETLKKNNRDIGIDLGLTDYIVTSDGFTFHKPKHLQDIENRLKFLQKSLSRKEKGSNNRMKAKLLLAKLHAKLVDRRKDWLNKITTQLIQEYQTIYIEDLNVGGMMKNHHLAKAISDACWGEFARQLEYKGKWYGREVIKIGRWEPTSKKCSACGFLNKELKLSDRNWICKNCGVIIDRDFNAAINILEAGRALTACGETVRPVKDSSSNGKFLRSKNTDKTRNNADSGMTNCSHAEITM